MDTNFVIGLNSRVYEKCKKHIYSELRKKGYSDLAPSHGDILYLVLIYGDLSMMKISEMVHRDKSTVTALVKKLQKLGYVEKVRGEVDRRQWIISATAKGQQFKKEFLDISTTLLDRVYRGFEDQEKEQLIQLLSRVNDNLS